jgi:hypothetical protein
MVRVRPFFAENTLVRTTGHIWVYFGFILADQCRKTMEKYI